jgi:PD-(D/E)XK endonuclease
MEQHYLKSSFREKLIEHLFIGELLKLSWLEGGCSLEIAKPEVDNQGYDLIAEQNGVIRHIQLKAAHLDAKAANQRVHIALSRKSSGCVVWVYFDEVTLELGPFLFFGGSAGLLLPSIEGFKVAKHTKANAEGIKAERPEIREITKAQFKRYSTVQEIYDLLFKVA